MHSIWPAGVTGARVQHSSHTLCLPPPAPAPQCSLQEACARCRYDWMREALVAWITSRGWDAAAAACRACAPAATATPQQASQPAPVAQQHQQQAPCPAPSPPQPVPQQAAAQQTLACAAVMATGQAPAEASVPSPVERIAVST